MKVESIKGLTDYLEKETSAVLTVPIDDKNSIHSAAMLYVHKQSPLQFAFITNGETIKTKLIKASPQQAACVVGTNRGCPIACRCGAGQKFSNTILQRKVPTG